MPGRGGNSLTIFLCGALLAYALATYLRGGLSFARNRPQGVGRYHMRAATSARVRLRKTTAQKMTVKTTTCFAGGLIKYRKRLAYVRGGWRQWLAIDAHDAQTATVSASSNQREIGSSLAERRISHQAATNGSAA